MNGTVEQFGSLEEMRRAAYAKCEELGEAKIEELLALDGTPYPVGEDLARYWLERKRTERREKVTMDAVVAAQRAADAAERSAKYTRAAAWASAIAAIVALGVAILGKAC